jgi:hypothetical protein
MNRDYTMRTIFNIILLIAVPLAFYGQRAFTSSNLPIVLINTNGKTIPNEPKIDAELKIIYNGEGVRNNVTDSNYDFNGTIGIELRGNSSQSFNQKQYGFETRTNNGENLNVPLLGLPNDNDWILYAPYNDISLIRNVLAYHLWSEMGYWGPRTRMVELILNGNYQGVYVLTEPIKQGKNRVDIAKLNPSDTTGRELTGGYIMRIDATTNEDLTFTSKIKGIGTTQNKTVTWMHHYPKPKNIQASQQVYIQHYIDRMEELIASDQYNDPVTGYAQYIDIGSFVDYFIHTELSHNADGFKRSAYFYKKKDASDGTVGKLFAGPVWDFNLAFGSCNFCNANKIDVWSHNGCETNPTPILWKRLINDPAFANAVKCRYSELRENILNTAYLNEFIDSYAIRLDESQKRHFEKWPELFSSSTGGFWGSDLWFSAYRVSTYHEEITIFKKWLSDRIDFLDKNLQGTCFVSAHETESTNNIKVFPNPFRSVVKIESEVELTGYALYNMQGKLIENREIPSLRQLEISDTEQLPTGLYFICLTRKNGKIFKTSFVKH